QQNMPAIAGHTLSAKPPSRVKTRPPWPRLGGKRGSLGRPAHWPGLVLASNHPPGERFSPLASESSIRCLPCSLPRSGRSDAAILPEHAAKMLPRENAFFRDAFALECKLAVKNP